jgi:hypothetical protein
LRDDTPSAGALHSRGRSATDIGVTAHPLSLPSSGRRPWILRLEPAFGWARAIAEVLALGDNPFELQFAGVPENDRSITLHVLDQAQPQATVGTRAYAGRFTGQEPTSHECRDARSAQLIQLGAASAVIAVPSIGIGLQRSQHHSRSLPVLALVRIDAKGMRPCGAVTCWDRDDYDLGLKAHQNS